MYLTLEFLKPEETIISGDWLLSFARKIEEPNAKNIATVNNANNNGNEGWEMENGETKFNCLLIFLIAINCFAFFKIWLTSAIFFYRFSIIEQPSDNVKWFTIKFDKN